MTRSRSERCSANSSPSCVAPARARTTASASASRRSLSSAAAATSRRQLRAQNAVVNPAAGRRLDEPGRVADDERPIGVGAVDGAERQELLPRRLGVVASMPQRPRHPIDHARRSRPSGSRARHHADADVACRLGRTTGTAHANPPGATVAGRNASRRRPGGRAGSSRCAVCR